MSLPSKSFAAVCELNVFSERLSILNTYINSKKNACLFIPLQKVILLNQAYTKSLRGTKTNRLEMVGAKERHNNASGEKNQLNDGTVFLLLYFVLYFFTECRVALMSCHV